MTTAAYKEVKALYGDDMAEFAKGIFGFKFHMVGFDKKNIFVGNEEKNVAIDRKKIRVVSTFHKTKKTSVKRKK